MDIVDFLFIFIFLNIFLGDNDYKKIGGGGGEEEFVSWCVLSGKEVKIL